jgi:hypothetical protein
MSLPSILYTLDFCSHSRIMRRRFKHELGLAPQIWQNQAKKMMLIGGASHGILRLRYNKRFPVFSASITWFTFASPFKLYIHIMSDKLSNSLKSSNISSSPQL